MINITDRLYKHGLPFSESLAPNLDNIMKRIDNKKASLIIIDGGVGEGKTTLAVECADYVQGHHINFKNQYAMGGGAFQEKLELCHTLKLKVVIYDEAGDFSKRGALTSFNKRLNRIFDTYRAYRILIILILPCFNVLDNHLFDLKIPRLLLNCYNRNNYSGNYRAFSLYGMHYVKFRMKNPKLVIKEWAYNQVNPNFRGHYLDISPERSTQLDLISQDGKKKILTESILESQGLICITTIQKKLNRSSAWVRDKLKKLKLKPIKTYKKRKYYESSIIEILREEIKL